MQWLNEPPMWRENNGILTVRAAAKTDFWRKTHDSGIRDNGHFCFVPAKHDFSVAVEIVGEYQAQYDQAGLMVRLNEVTWLKCGVELKDGIQYASVVVTRDWSDWSVVRLDRPESIWFRVQRRQHTLEVEFSLDGEAFQMLRQTFLTEAPALDVGPMLAAPKGDGFLAVFKDLNVQHR
jgi:regulation of enolase protein 1 (concanavalin A-like superfamily)